MPFNLNFKYFNYKSDFYFNRDFIIITITIIIIK